MSALSRAQAAFVFRYIAERSFGQDEHGNYRSTGLEATTTYDAGFDFVCAFQETFPGKIADPNSDKASARLRRLLKRLHDDDWLDRWRCSNHDQYHPMNEPNWQFVYKLPQWLINDIKTGRTTPEAAATEWSG